MNNSRSASATMQFFNTMQPVALIKRLKVYCAIYETSPSDVVQKLLEDFLTANSLPSVGKDAGNGDRENPSRDGRTSRVAGRSRA